MTPISFEERRSFLYLGVPDAHARRFTMLTDEQQKELAVYLKQVAANALLEAVDNHKKSLRPPAPDADPEIPVTVDVPVRDREPSLLGLDSKAPTPVTWFSRFMIWKFPDPKERAAAVNVVVRRAMQVVSLVSAIVLFYLTTLVAKLEAKVDHVTAPAKTIEAPKDAGAE